MKPADIRLERSPMGGGWAIPETDNGRRIGAEVMGEDPAPIAPLGGVAGWILEPADAMPYIESMMDSGLRIQTVSGAVLP